MAEDSAKVWPTGLTDAEARELHDHLISGTRYFGGIALVAHFLVWQSHPWGKGAVATVSGMLDSVQTTALSLISMIV
jgi:light-harvesting protein B-800-850 beta chain